MLFRSELGAGKTTLAKAIAAALEDVNTHNTTLAVYPLGWHMLLRDLQAKRVWNDVLVWVKNPEHALPSGAESAVGDFWKSYRQGKAVRQEK